MGAFRSSVFQAISQGVHRFPVTTTDSAFPLMLGGRVGGQVIGNLGRVHLVECHLRPRQFRPSISLWSRRGWVKMLQLQLQSHSMRHRQHNKGIGHGPEQAGRALGQRFGPSHM